MTETICPTIFDGKTISTPWAQILMGTVNKDGVVSFRIQPKVQAGRPVTHYMQMDLTGDDPTNQRRGSTEFRGGGAFKVYHGDEIQKGMQAIFIRAENGDMTIQVPNGKLKIEAAQIDLISDNGEVTITTKKMAVDTTTLSMKSKADTTIEAEKKLSLLGNGSIYQYGGSMEFTDGAALLWGSKSGFGIPFIPVSSLNAISTLGHLAQRLSSYFSG
jgi:hypothetical protein